MHCETQSWTAHTRKSQKPRALVRAWTERLLFLDVDGVLIPFGGPRQHPVYPPAPPTEADASPLLARINPGHGPRLKALACELAWATTWADDASGCHD